MIELGPVIQSLMQGNHGSIAGLVLARVEAIHEDGYELHYLSISLRGEGSRARSLSPMSGDRTGMFMMPSIHDIVAVMFETGDPDLPIIIGSIYSPGESRATPPQADTSASNNVRTIVSRSGHEVTLDDSPGAEKIEIRSQGGFEIVIDDAARSINIKTSGAIATSRIVLDGVSWNHIHPVPGVGMTEAPISKVVIP